MQNSKVLINSLPRDYIQVGNIIWYEGTTSASGWNCPAIIRKVYQDEERFQVTSCDDMREQNQAYSFEVTENSPKSRVTMRVPSEDEVERYFKDGLRTLSISHRSSTMLKFSVKVVGTITIQNQFFIEKWKEKSGVSCCAGIGSREILFKNESDAILFHMTFSGG